MIRFAMECICGALKESNANYRRGQSFLTYLILFLQTYYAGESAFVLLHTDGTRQSKAEFASCFNFELGFSIFQTPAKCFLFLSSMCVGTADVLKLLLQLV